ncbi:hypothetical protein [Cellulomonas endophytica]|uniref:hypothetical protein n=1 Tax=Cellulomonas endophytica TaxID=2494735 RepID=UPI0010120DD8|nr:hypothetical protein [Cellulomonas endophytica]
MSTVPGDDAFRDAGLVAASPGGNGPFEPDHDSRPRPSDDDSPSFDEAVPTDQPAGAGTKGDGGSGVDDAPFGGEDAPVEP